MAGPTIHPIPLLNGLRWASGRSSLEEGDLRERSRLALCDRTNLGGHAEADASFGSQRRARQLRVPGCGLLRQSGQRALLLA
ncbi:hypothetical protein D3C81_1543100 [compost metagenome]